MLTIAKLRGALSRVEYLTFPGLSERELQGTWIGSAAPLAGLEPGSRVDPSDLLLTLEGYSPRDRVRLQHHRKPYPVRTAGWDFTFSVAKSLSLAAADPDVSPVAVDILTSVEAAIDALWPVIEHMLAPNGSQAQPGPTEPTPAIAARYTHLLSRPGDPHVHVHLIVPNTCVVHTTNGLAWRAVDPIRPLLASQDLDRLFQAEIARNMVACGYPVVLDKDGRAQLPAIPAELCARYSKAQQAIIAAELEERSTRTGPMARKQSRARSIINQRIRQPKSYARGRSSLSNPDRARIRHVLEPLSRLRIRPNKRVRKITPYERAYRQKLLAAAKDEIAAREANDEIGRQVIARSMRSVANSNFNTPLGAVLFAILVWIRVAEQRRRRHYALLGVDDDDSRQLARDMASRRRRGPLITSPTKTYAATTKAHDAHARPASPAHR